MKLISINHTTPLDGNGDTSYGLLTQISKGQKLIIVVNAGGEQGCVPNAYVHFSDDKHKGLSQWCEYWKHEIWRKENYPKSSKSINGFTDAVYSGDSGYRFC